MERITIFNAQTIFEEGFDTVLIVSYYDSEKQEFEKLSTKINSNFVQDLASGFSNQKDIELLIESKTKGKEKLTEEEIEKIYNELFNNQSTYKMSKDDVNTTRAKNIFIQLSRDSKLKELGI